MRPLLREFRVRSAPDGTLLIFGISASVDRSVVAAYQPAAETSECLVVEAPAPDVAFPLHAEAVSAYFMEPAKGNATTTLSPA